MVVRFWRLIGKAIETETPSAIAFIYRELIVDVPNLKLFKTMPAQRHKNKKKDFTLLLQKSRMPQIQGIKGKAVVNYREPLITPEMWYYRLSRRGKI